MMLNGWLFWCPICEFSRAASQLRHSERHTRRQNGVIFVVSSRKMGGKSLCYALIAFEPTMS
jgi:hypothetical protein